MKRSQKQFNCFIIEFINFTMILKTFNFQPKTISTRSVIVKFRKPRKHLKLAEVVKKRN